jgi:Domain of unknown function (DUF3644)
MICEARGTNALRKSWRFAIAWYEKFNCPFERGRVTSVLIALDHAFEMLLKASTLQRGGRIRKRGAAETLGFDACVRVGLSDGKVKFLTEEQAFTLQMLNGLRDAAQHHLIAIQEAHLYIHAQSAATLFRDLLKTVFRKEFFAAREVQITDESAENSD